MSTLQAAYTICFPIFPNATILDIAGPYQVFAGVPGVTQYLAAASKEPLKTAEGMVIVPDCEFDHCPPFDVLMVPGGPGQVQAMEDEAYMSFLRTRGAEARYVAADCVGALLLAWAGLLDGFTATTHWASLPCLALFPRVKIAAGYPRYVVDGNRVTGGGVSSGIDEALEIARLLMGAEAAERAQLIIQYAPDPPFRAGDPCQAPREVLATAETALEPLVRTRREQILRLLGRDDEVPDARPVSPPLPICC